MPENKLVDLNADAQNPGGFYRRAGGDVTRAERLMREAGFAGYSVDRGDGVRAYALFEPHPAEGIRKYEAGREPETLRDAPKVEPPPPGTKFSEWTEDQQNAALERLTGQKGIYRLSPIVDVPDGDKATPIPGGLEGKFSLKDLYWIKANPQFFDPNEWSDELHTKFMAKILRTYQPESGADGKLNPVDVYNWLVFAMQSPNMPLTQNQLVHSVIRARTTNDIERMAAMKGMTDKQIATAFNLQSRKKGGLGLRGSPNLKSVAEFADLFIRDPEWFQKRPGETDMQLTERLSTAIKGLALKTASFGTVWQNPGGTEVAPMDRHMINEGLETVQDPALKQRMINLWNKAHPDDQIKRWDKLIRWQDSRSFTINQMMGALTPKKAKYISAKTGKVNPNLPEHLATEKWIKDPERVSMLSDPYRELLGRNIGLAKARGLGLYGSQWLEWKRHSRQDRST